MRLTAIIFSLLLVAASAEAKLVVTTTVSDLAAIAEAVGGDQVEVSSIVKGTQDPHQIGAKPSFMVKMRGANLVVAMGLELESAWLKPLIDGARNPNIFKGTKGYLELGEELDPIEIPHADATRADGDVHPGGNPHFQLDPIRLGRAAIIIGDRMAELDAAHSTLFKANAVSFQKKMVQKTGEWKARLEKTGIKEVVSYHKTLNYFFDRFSIKGNLQLEPKPGIPPTASHIIEVINQMKQRSIKLVLIENYFDDAAGAKIRQEIPNAKVIKLPVQVGGEPEIKTNEQLFERIVSALEAAAK